VEFEAGADPQLAPTTRVLNILETT
jgi:hypothetical protein